MQESKELVGRFWKAYGNQDIDGCVALVTQDMALHGSTNQGREGLRAELIYWYEALPDLSLTVEDLIADGDRVAVRVTYSATHTGEVLGVPTTGKNVTWPEIDIFRIEDGEIGEIGEIWASPDLYALLGQIGGLPEAEAE